MSSPYFDCCCGTGRKLWRDVASLGIAKATFPGRRPTTSHICRTSRNRYFIHLGLSSTVIVGLGWEETWDSEEGGTRSAHISWLFELFCVYLLKAGRPRDWKVKVKSIYIRRIYTNILPLVTGRQGWKSLARVPFERPHLDHITARFWWMKAFLNHTLRVKQYWPRDRGDRVSISTEFRICANGFGVHEGFGCGTEFRVLLNRFSWVIIGLILSCTELKY